MVGIDHQEEEIKPTSFAEIILN